MGHTHDDFADVVFAATLKNAFEAGDEGFATFEGEAFLAEVAGLEKVFEILGLENGFEDTGFLLLRENRFEALRLDAGLKPAAAGCFLDVYIFSSDSAAVSLFQALNQFAERHFDAAQVIAGVKDGFEVAFFKAQSLEGEARVARCFLGERVELRNGVTDRSVSVEHSDESSLLNGIRIGSGAWSRAVGRVRAASVGLSQLEAFEESTPFASYIVGIGEPSVVIFVNQVRIPAACDS